MRIIDQFERSFNFDQITIYVSEDNAIRGYYTDSSPLLLGKYKTPNRTQEVFNEIHTFYEIPFTDKEKVYHMPLE